MLYNQRHVLRNVLLFIFFFSFTLSVLLILSTFMEERLAVPMQSSESRISLIQQVRIFPQGGGDVKFDQPWRLPDVVVIKELADLQSGPQKYIVSNFSYSPGLGNLMFQYASLRAIAAKYGAKVLLPIDCTLRRAFNLDAVFVSRALNDYLIGKFDAVKHHFEELLIREQFRFLPSVAIRANDLILEAKAEKIRATAGALEGDNVNEIEQAAIPDIDESTYVYVGVHVRHGMDITLNSRNTKHGHTVATREYFKNAMNYFRQKYNNIVFIITSDNRAWMSAHIDVIRRGEVYFLNSRHREVDLAALALCNHTIMSTGTFSWWAAYLADGDAVYYGDWPNPGSVLERTVHKKDFFLEKWIAIR
uniref:L-Fucosyltransferase n=1 Tax=Parascaris univalens TaxID=6257 RepID=A0A915BDB2_PARUN